MRIFLRHIHRMGNGTAKFVIERGRCARFKIDEVAMPETKGARLVVANSGGEVIALTILHGAGRPRRACMGPLFCL